MKYLRILFAWFGERYPIRKRATWAALIALLGNLGIQLGLEELVTVSEALQDGLSPVWTLLVLAGLVKASEAKVTPVASPRDDSGATLVPIPPPPPQV